LLITDCLKAGLPSYLTGGNLKVTNQDAIQQFDEKQVNEIVDKEWKKLRNSFLSHALPDE
jgi:hypothetical protein